MVRLLTTISLVMASYSEGYHENNVVMKLANSVLSGGKYLLDPELRAEKVCSQLQLLLVFLQYFNLLSFCIMVTRYIDSVSPAIL